jgi:hypothetical protein
VEVLLRAQPAHHSKEKERGGGGGKDLFCEEFLRSHQLIGDFALRVVPKDLRVEVVVDGGDAEGASPAPEGELIRRQAIVS